MQKGIAHNVQAVAEPGELGAPRASARGVTSRRVGCRARQGPEPATAQLYEVGPAPRNENSRGFVSSPPPIDIRSNRAIG